MYIDVNVVISVLFCPEMKNMKLHCTFRQNNVAAKIHLWLQHLSPKRIINAVETLEPAQITKELHRSVNQIIFSPGWQSRTRAANSFHPASGSSRLRKCFSRFKNRCYLNKLTTYLESTSLLSCLKKYLILKKWDINSPRVKIRTVWLTGVRLSMPQWWQKVETENWLKKNDIFKKTVIEKRRTWRKNLMTDIEKHILMQKISK